ncbi:Eco57I restriction-modification methylase domain-containing protein [Natrinema pallidum]|uniref:site-specific DNA-methyltransferase (adenine-specific) n=1 Tax=Natrinema pallidum DSM 3751 TaxID=1227495 RepID=L9ZCQ9_9EURY|nr:TaqI-like C-terminal specificity domain-containing protein [Natrinema pallidum]ELY84184.1 putative restriction/modification enzyme [Natrinema pallidum DSM 3751]
MTDSSTYRTNRDLFSNHYLEDHLRETEPWNDVPDDDVEMAFEEINDLWAEKQERVDDYNEAQLEKNFIRPIFDILGIPFEIEETVMRNARRPDYGFFPSEEAVDAAFDRENFYEESIAVADAKRWGRKLDTRGEEKRDFENPSYQIHRYLQETPTQWAVLTNGKKWRLYYGPTSHRLDSYYEIDLPELLDVADSEGDFEAFKEFYLFFRQEAFLPDQTGDCFLDDVYDESSVFAEELGEDLQENIYEAIRVLAEGFLDTNDDLDEDDLDLIHDSSLIYLYRLIFVLYAESEGRNLLPTDNEIYSGSYSLNELKQTVVENRDATQQHYQTWQTNLWDRLEELFVLIDEGSQGQGIPKKDLYIPAYNGGLFRTSPDNDDSVESQFLSNYKAGDAYLAEVIELLTRHEASDGEGKVFVDYSSLDERNLGSIYEGLLEYKLDVADEPLTVDDGEYTPAGDDDDITVEVGEVYLRTDDGERKATGSYYTPEYVVEYIVDETLGPLVDEIRSDLMSQSADTTHSREGGFADEFAERIFALTVLDPAMGSGHFPVNAVDYLAREIIDAQEEQDRQAIDAEDAEIRPPTTEEGELRDINWARRKVAQRCIYGVDVNPLATELAKVSLWLRTLAAEQPLAFLDHHLKTGNSLVGSDIEDVLTNGDDDATGDGQLTLQQSFDHTRQRAMEHVTDRFQDLLNIDNETLEDAKEMEAVYDDVRADPLYKKLLAMANVHTANAFGLDVPGDADERMARALHSDAWEKIEQQDWFKSAQAMAEDDHFFHWELEFPMAFYDQDGERKADAGFDAVIGNPPWVNVGRMKGKPAEADYYNEQFKTAEYQVDLYTLFLERGMDMLSKGSPIGFIVPDPWLANYRTPKIREFLLIENQPRKIIHSPQSAFPEVGAEHLIYIGERSDGFEDPFLRGEMDDDAQVEINDEFSSSLLREEDGYVVYTHSTVAPILNQIESRSRNLGSLYETVRGVGPYHHSQQDQEIIDDRAYHADKKEDDTYVPELKGKHLSRYSIQWEGDTWISYGPWLAEPREKRFFEGKRLLLREILGERFQVDVISEEFVVDRGIYIALQGDQEIDLLYALALLGSKASVFWFREKYSENDELFPKLRVAHFEKLPIRDVQFDLPETERNSTVESLFSEYQSLLDGEMDREKMLSAIFEYTSDDTEIVHDLLVRVAEEQKSHLDDRNSINLELLDYLGTYEEGLNLPDIGIFQPSSPEYLDATSEDYENLRVGDVRTVLEGDTVIVEATARYKPENEDEYETDQWGYRETDYETVFSVTNLSDEEATLVEAFVPVAVDKAGGFAGFRETATKTNSLVDRLKAMTLPDTDDIGDDLRRYVVNRERADELDAKIEKTDQLIDEIVYDLYDLTDEEIEIVEEAVADD